MTDEIVRWPVEPLRRDRRGLDERLAMRLPGLARSGARWLARMPAGSRLRRALITRAVRVGYAANNRLDYEALFLYFHPQCEFRAIGLETPVDLPSEVKGVDGMRAFLDAQRAGFDELRYEPTEVVDPGGDRFGARLRFVATARGLEVEQEAGTTLMLEDGWVIQQDLYGSFDTALAALRERPPS